MKMKYLAVLIGLFAAAALKADTYTHKTKKTVYHGYQLKTDENGLTEVHTIEAGPHKLNLTEYNHKVDSQGRNSFVSVLNIHGAIEYDLETSAFESAIQEEADKGPLFILIELDTPGGRVDLAQRICTAIMDLKRCKTVAFIPGGQEGGAYSAGAAIALSCDKIYMAPGSSFGAATLVASRGGHTVDIEKVAGENVGEKSRSAWRTYLAAMAQRNGRPEALARAMEDKDISVLEVNRDGKKEYIESTAQKSTDSVVKVFCKKGELLTLTTNQAVESGMADGIAESRVNLLKLMDAGNAEFKTNESTAKAREEIDRVFKKMEKLGEMLDLRFKELSLKSQRGALTRSVALRDFQGIVKQAEYLLKLKKQYPDVPIPEEILQEFLNDVKAEYESIRAMR